MTHSAAGQFKATGKTRKTRPAVVDGRFVKTGERPRAEDDFEPTPPEPTLSLCAYEAAHLRRFSLIWEPACGDGRMARDLVACGHDVTLSDKIDRGCGAVVRDFFSYDRAPAAAIVTNPPFNACNWSHGKGRWISHALGTLGVEYMALLLPLTWMCVEQLGPLRARYRPSVIYPMNWRIDFTGEKQQPANHAWYVWDVQRPPGRSSQLVEMFRADPRQQNMELR